MQTYSVYCVFVFLKYKARNFNSDVIVVCCGGDIYNMKYILYAFLNLVLKIFPNFKCFKNKCMLVFEL